MRMLHFPFESLNVWAVSKHSQGRVRLLRCATEDQGSPCVLLHAVSGFLTMTCSWFPTLSCQHYSKLLVWGFYLCVCFFNFLLLDVYFSNLLKHPICTPGAFERRRTGFYIFHFFIWIITFPFAWAIFVWRRPEHYIYFHSATLRQNRRLCPVASCQQGIRVKLFNLHI